MRYQDGFLFEFATSGRSYFYTSLDVDVEVNNKLYKAIPIESRTELRINSIVDNATWQIALAPTASIAELWKDNHLEALVSVTVYRYEKVSAMWLVYWHGYLTNPQFTDEEVLLNCESEFSSLRSRGLKRRAQPSCPHDVYSNECGASPSAHVIEGVVSSIDTNFITVDVGVVIPDNHLAGGWVQWNDSQTATPIYRYVRGNVGAVIEFNYLVYNLPIGRPVELFPGCDGTVARCKNTFGNDINHGGIAYRPDINPFGGTRLF